MSRNHSTVPPRAEDVSVPRSRQILGEEPSGEAGVSSSPPASSDDRPESGSPWPSGSGLRIVRNNNLPFSPFSVLRIQGSDSGGPTIIQLRGGDRLGLHEELLMRKGG